ncbi:hypothetical protein FEM48_Zijuj05G0151900 [Ziziphus jujuba var. spinosa]|uniref:Disease resistance protein At4g27190-like leucine-rich repeats domain-containing protein n=1 Tax=Ziziphus jujuba var. spinosa TaxID=714518 RepID=A0A978VFJ4_ZIZJJ|nr:hypothetical protein FEM48_Zijuj05G0151900 [Ziziphus jujuba var. spinosa]
MLRDLRIWECPELKSFIYESSEENSNTTVPSLFNKNFICFPKLENLDLNECHVKKIWDDEFLASSTSFCCLKKLDVYACKFLKCVVSSSTAASFNQLESLEVRGCEAMELIVRRDERMDKMSFPKLSLLTLWNLPRLSKFSSGIFSEFPMLWELDIQNCPELKTFISESFEEKANTTMPSLFNENFICFPKLEKLRLVGCLVKKIWDDEFLASSTSFCCLKKLDVDDCKFLKCVVSSSMAASFKQLEDLKVTKCEAMELIVRKDERMDKMSFPKLSLLSLGNLPRLSKFSSGIFSEFPMLCDLYIRNCPELKTFISESFEEKANTTMPSLFSENVALPSLKTVWVEGVDGLKMIWQYGRLSNNAESFCQLEDVKVEKCKNLMGIFSSGMHTRLGNLKWLKISECEMVEEIFEMETSNCGIEEVAGKQEGLETVVSPDDEFVFPQLREMELQSLPNLVSFYAGRHTLSFPLLEELEVIECLKVKAFSGSELLSYQGRHESLFSTIFSTKVRLSFFNHIDSSRLRS